MTQLQTSQVSVRTIDHFLIGSEQSEFGPLEFAGGLEMIGSSRHFGAISAIDIANNQSDFVAVADTGFWIAGKIERKTDGTASGLADVSISEITGASGKPIIEKWQADAEGISIDGNKVTVSFERAHRIVEYTVDAGSQPRFQREYAPPVPLYELRNNRGFEGIAQAPAGSTLSGKLVGISEKSLDKNRNIMGFARSGDGDSFEFSVRRKNEFDVTDLDFLPGGDLIVLERRFNVADGIGMRLRHIKSGDIEPGATVDGPTMLEADFLYQIDNMEGLSITTDPDGVPRLSIVSDDNHSLLQRNLLIEFRLVGAIE